MTVNDIWVMEFCKMENIRSTAAEDAAEPI